MEDDPQGEVVVSGEAFDVTDVTNTGKIVRCELVFIQFQKGLFLEDQELVKEVSKLSLDSINSLFELSEQTTYFHLET